MPDRVKAKWIAIGAGVLIAACVTALFAARPVPDAVIALLGGPDGGVDRLGGVRVRYRPPAGLAPEELARAVGRSSVRRDGEALVLELPGVAEAMIPELADLLATGGLGMFEVLETPYAHELGGLLEIPLSRRRDRAGGAPGVTIEVETWQAERGGRRHTAWYLEAPSRGELEDALAAAEARGFRAAPGSWIGLEQVEGSGGDPPSWRTHELSTQLELDGAMIERAVKSYDPYTSRPIVLLDFTAAGARRFCDVTARLVGRKLAMVLGGRIRSAPVINSSICGGRASITVGGGEPRRQEREADLLVAVLSQPALPAGGVVEAASWHPPPRLAAQEWLGRLALGLGAGALGGLLAALVIRLARPRWRVAPEPVAGPFPYPRLAVTLLAPLALYLGGKLVLPGVDEVELEHMFAWAERGSARQFSVVALGVAPILTAFLLVELAALAIPALRWRRHDPRGRVRLGQAVAALSIALAVVQGYFAAVYLEALSRGGVELVASPGLGFRALAAVTLAAGTLLLAALAGMIREHGLGNGYGALLAGGTLVEVLPIATAEGPPGLGGGHAVGLVALVAIAAITAAALRWRIGDPDPRAPALRVPSCGLAPLSDAGGLAIVLGLLAGIGLAGALIEPALWVHDLQRASLLALGLLAALVPLWSYLFARPPLVERVARAAGLPAPSWGAWRRATLASAALLIAVHGVAALAIAAGAGAAVLAAPIPVMIGTAVILDAVDDARAHRRRLAPAGVLHQIQHAGVVERVLADAGIPCHLHAGNLRTLLAFFGPFAPAIVLVPESLAMEARLRLAAAAAAASGRGEPAGTGERSSP